MRCPTGYVSVRVKCHECPSQFLSREDLNLHEQLSHNSCPHHNDQFQKWADLKDHCSKFQCAHVCEGCDGIWNTIEAFDKHNTVFNVCKTCQRHFDTFSNLVHHELTHRIPMYGCIACPRKFTTYGGMIIHLESGACSSGIEEYDLAVSTAKCYQGSKFFVKKSIRVALKARFNILQELRAQFGSALVFRCPTCDHKFPKLSSLFMHVESSACSQTLRGGAVGKLRTWLFKCYG